MLIANQVNQPYVKYKNSYPNQPYRRINKIISLINDNLPWSIGILITLFLAVAGYRFAHYKDRKKSSEKFRNIILTELKNLYPIPAKWPADVNLILEPKFSTLQAAVEEYKLSLPFYKRNALQKAWFQFYCPTGREIDKNCTSFYHYSVGSDKKERFKHNLNQLLKCAKT
jgi:hypothetical protein